MNKSRHKLTHTSWKNMRDRCTYKSCGNYERYGARGISYDPRWNSYESFVEDMGERPEGMTLDRIDSNKNYCKENCRWATPAQQQANRRNCMHITYNGITQTSADWSRSLGLAKGAVWNRIKAGWDVEKAVTTRKVGTAY